MFNLLKKLMKPVSVSGNESEADGVVAAEISQYVDSVKIDALGNLIAFREGVSSDKKKIMFAAHIDEIGFIVTHIEENGYIRFQKIGGINFVAAAYSKVVFDNGIRGVLVPEAKTKPEDYSEEKFLVDIGAKSKKEAERRVGIGRTFAVESELTKLNSSYVTGRPIDNRVGAAILIEAAKRLSGKDVENDIYFCFTSQEEVGCRGALTAAYGIAPHIGIALDVTGTGDTAGASPMEISLGKGAAIKLKDSSVVCDRILVDKMKKTADKNKIKYQLEILARGGTDTSSIQRSAAGVIAGCISIPTRYIHTSVETVDLSDVEECVKLTVALANEEYISIM